MLCRNQTWGFGLQVLQNGFAEKIAKLKKRIFCLVYLSTGVSTFLTMGGGTTSGRFW